MLAKIKQLLIGEIKSEECEHEEYIYIQQSMEFLQWNYKLKTNQL